MRLQVLQTRFRSHATTDAAGRFRIEVPASGAFEAWLELDGPDVVVKPLGDQKLPYPVANETSHVVIPIVLHAGHNDVRIDREAQAAVANVWRAVNDAATFAKQALAGGARLPKVNVYVPYTRGFTRSEGQIHSQYSLEQNAIFIDSGSGNKFRDKHEWDDFVIQHEYGHHVLFRLAYPGDDAGGDHEATGVYPDHPARAWSEGFADAFAALVAGNSVVRMGCDPVLNLGTEPARPEPAAKDRDLAAYNEAAAGGVIWHLVTRSARPATALGELLTAAARFHSPAHPFPQSMRELRDALVGTPLEPDTPAGHDAVDKLFAAQHMGWGLALSIGYDGDALPDDENLHLQLQLPDGRSCERAGTERFIEHPVPITGRDVPWDGWVLDGPIASAWRDECFILSGTDDARLGQFHGVAMNGSFGYWFPYLAGEAHLGTYTLWASYDCHRQVVGSGIKPCPSSYQFHFDMLRGWALEQATSASDLPLDTFDPLELADPGHVLFPDEKLTLQLGSRVPLVRFTGAGTCTILGSGQHKDCSV